MALHFSSACLSSLSQRRMHSIRAAASESSSVTVEEDKVKLGGSLKVTKLGIGAWSWGDTSYWIFEWDGCKKVGKMISFLCEAINKSGNKVHIWFTCWQRSRNICLYLLLSR